MTFSCIFEGMFCCHNDNKAINIIYFSQLCFSNHIVNNFNHLIEVVMYRWIVTENSSRNSTGELIYSK